MEYHNTYAVDPTVYATTYIASTGALPMGKEKTPSVRESTGRRSVSGKRFSITVAPLV